MLRTEYGVDAALAASFPASDPPPWNAGFVRPRPTHTASGTREAAKARLRRDPYLQRGVSRTPASRRNGSEVSLLQALVSLAAAGGLVVLLPFVILAVGIPIALVVRGLLEILQWVFPAMR